MIDGFNFSTKFSTNLRGKNFERSKNLVGKEEGETARAELECHMVHESRGGRR